MSYSKKHYDSRVILNDIATIVRTALVVWEEWATLCDEQVEWTLTPQLIAITSRLDALDSKHFPVSP